MSVPSAAENNDKPLPAPVTAGTTAEGQGHKTAIPEVVETSEAKGKVNGRHLHPNQYYGNSILRIPSPDTLSELSVDDNGLVRPGRGSIAIQRLGRIASRSPARPRRTLKERSHDFWIKNKGLGLVLLAQIFGTLMNVTTRCGHSYSLSSLGLKQANVKPP
jgi:hypothetical protein